MSSSSDDELRPTISGSNNSSTSSAEPSVFYVCAVGQRPGIYTTWKECTRGIGPDKKSAKFKKFEDKAEAIEWIKKVKGVFSIIDPNQQFFGQIPDLNPNDQSQQSTTHSSIAHLDYAHVDAEQNEQQDQPASYDITGRERNRAYGESSSTSASSEQSTSKTTTDDSTDVDDKSR
eukprot:UN02974